MLVADWTSFMGEVPVVLGNSKVGDFSCDWNL